MITVVHEALDVRIFHKEARALSEAGWRVWVIGLGREGRREFKAIEVIGLRRLSRWARPVNWARVLKAAVRCRADIYHVHDPELLVIAPLLKLFGGGAVVYDAHEYLVKNIQLKHWIPRLLRRPVGRLAGWLERLLLRAVDAVVLANAPHCVRYRWFRRPVVVVANYAPRASHPGPAAGGRGSVVVYIGALSRTKGVEVLLDAFQRVRARVPTAELWLVGAAQPASYEKMVREHAAGIELGTAVRLYGRVPFPQVWDLLGRAAVGVVTYLPVGDYSECYPTKLFEYMAAGIPCVCSDIPLWGEIVEGAGCGLVVDPSDPGAVADALLYLLQHPEEAAEMGKRGRRAFLERYTWETEAEKLVALYEQLYARRRKKQDV